VGTAARRRKREAAAMAGARSSVVRTRSGMTAGARFSSGARYRGTSGTDERAKAA
jgi:hypothetical protein